MIAYLSQLRQHGFDPDLLNQYQVVCLPENLFSAERREDLLEAGQSADIAKILKESGLRCAQPHDLGIAVPVIERRSLDLWCGLIWIRDYLAAPIIAGVISSWLTAKCFNSKEGQLGSKEPPTVHVEIAISKRGQISLLRYEGNAETLIQLLKGLDQPDAEESEHTN